ncbi:MAG: glycosyltransferase [Lachnospirales bacterium]
MRFVLINELYEKGGAEMQTKRERDLLRKHGHEVLYITLDTGLPSGKLDDDINHWNFSFDAFSDLEKLRFRFFTNQKLKRQLEQVIMIFSPDYIHINNITDVRAVSVYKAIKKYKTFQTIRDYSAVCPMSLCITDCGETCEGFCSIDICNKLCRKNYDDTFQSKTKLYLNRFVYIWQKIIRIQTVNFFIAPSQCLTDYCNKHGFNTTCVNNPFDFSMVETVRVSEREKYNDKIFLFYGLVAEHKGILQLIEAFNRFCAHNPDGLLYIAGSLDGVCNDVFYSMIKNNSRIHYLGKQTYKDMIEILTKVFAVVVPSLWLENYPNTVLEGMATKSLVIGSDRGGIPEMIGDSKWLFNIYDVNSIVNCMENAQSLSYEEYYERVNAQYLHIKDNNAMECYYDRILKFMEKKFNENTI